MRHRPLFEPYLRSGVIGSPARPSDDSLPDLDPPDFHRLTWLDSGQAGRDVDDGRTATEGFLSKRISFTRLIRDAALGLFDVVVIVDMDRLTRSEDLQERGRYSVRSSAPAFS